MIRQNRAVPILMVLTLAFVLYLGGCFGSEKTDIAGEESPTPVATPTQTPVVATPIDGAAPPEEPFFHTVEQGDRLPSIAAKYSVTQDVILLANPGLDPNVLLIGQQIRVPGATTDAEAFVDPEEARESGEEINYVVESGDTLGGIAERFTISLAALEDANPDVAAESLQVGQLLTIPPFGTGLPADAIAARTTPVPAQREPGEILEHVVAAGDLLVSLADLYSVTVDEIMDANGIDDANQIQVGQVLLIPTPSQTPAVDG